MQQRRQRLDFWPSEKTGERGKGSFCGNTFGYRDNWRKANVFLLHASHILSTAFLPLRAHRLMYGRVWPNLLLRPPPTIESRSLSYCVWIAFLLESGQKLFENSDLWSNLWIFSFAGIAAAAIQEHSI